MSDAPIREGEILAGKYRVERTLGIGGMGVVVAATHLHLDQRVAIKFLLPQALAHADIVARFAREARAACKVQSEHVARVIDVGQFETGAPYMVMEYLEGQDLAATIRSRGALPIPEAVDYVLQACEAIAEAHVAGIVHRDLKPQNLFLTKRADGSPCVKVLDFGISKVANTADAAMTKTQAIMGSPLYMSPEQLRSARKVDHRTDIWSLGVILHELLVGDVPFNAETMPALCGAILTEPPPPLRMVRPDAPAELEALVTRCLEKDAERRIANVAELAAAVAQFGTQSARTSAERIARIIHASGMGNMSAPVAAPASLPPGAATGTSWAQTSAPGQPATPTLAMAPPAKKAPVALFAALGFLLLAGGGAVFLLRGNPEPKPEVAATKGKETEKAAKPVKAEPAAVAEPSRLSISAKPSTAKLYLDDGALAGNPYTANIKADGSMHKLRIEAPGYKTQTLSVVFDKDVTVDVPLEPEAKAASPGAKPVAAPADPAGKSVKPKIDTADPYK